MFSKSVLRGIVLEQREEMEEIFSVERIIEREAKAEARKFLKYPNILAILGARRCGKSIFAYQLFRGNVYAYINFDDERLAGIDARDLNRILEVFYEIYGRNLRNIILDEPQNVPKWELFANRLRRTKKVIVTGSNSQLLSGELATALTGRHVTFELYPFSFREVLEFLGKPKEAYTTKERSELIATLRDFLENGGLPERFKFGRRIIREVYNDIITRDIVRRGKIKKEVEVKRATNFLISNFSNEFTFRSLKSIAGVKHLSTLSKWIELMKEAYLIIVLERFSFKIKKPTYAPKKVYLIDTGFTTTAGYRISENIGRLMENTVAVELFRRRSYWHPNWEIYYWKDHQQREVDFIVKNGSEIRQLIQVTYATGIDEIDRRELKSLIKAGEIFNCKNMLLITWDYEDKINIKNRIIKATPLWKWLLSVNTHKDRATR